MVMGSSFFIMVTLQSDNSHIATTVEGEFFKGNLKGKGKIIKQTPDGKGTFTQTVNSNSNI